MSRAFVLPDLGEGLVEAEIVGVLVREGDVIEEDAPLLEVETDKARVEIPSPIGGRVEKIHVRPGETVRVGAVLVTFSDAATPARPAPARAPDDGAQRVRPVEPTAPAAGTVAATAQPRHEGPVPATPATRRLARELGVDLRSVTPSGPGGRVTSEDVRAAAQSAAPAPSAPAQPPQEVSAGQPERPAPKAPTSSGEAAAPPRPLIAIAVPPLPKFEQWGPIERVPLSHLRRTIAERMTLSASVIPHVSHFDRADITDLDALILRNLEPARARGIALTLTSFLLKASAIALAAHPHFNASLDTATGELIVKRHCHLGVAVATERGLIVPVIRDVDKKPVLVLARELAALAQRTREGKAALDDLRGGTFTITNLGALGGTGALPIINYPEVAILGVARGRREPVVRDEQIVARLMLPLTLTFDHRVADGADGARFAADVVRLLEHPDQLLLEL